MAVREAVSIILAADINASDVYLVERNPDLRFFGGYYAFPGGTVDPADADVDVAHMPDKVPFLKQHIVCAARELFEEAGVLISQGPAIAPAALRGHRRNLLSQTVDFSAILRECRQTIDAENFIYVCQTLTPEFAPVRYDTRFFLVHSKQTPDVWAGELVDGNFFAATTALEKWRANEMHIVPPVVIMLEQIAAAGTLPAVQVIRAIAESYQQGRLHAVFWTPAVQMLTLQSAALPPANHTNTYLVGHQELYVIDPAPAQDFEQQRLLAYLDAEIESGKRLRGILLTHHHPDHTGAVLPCQQRYNLPVYAHPETIERLPEITFAEALTHQARLSLGASPDGHPDWQITCFHTPGHAPGHLIFQEDRYDGILTGDLVSTLSTVVIDPPEGDLVAYMRSLVLLQSLPPGTLFPGHGPALKDSAKLLDELIAHRRARELKLLAALTPEPQSLTQLVRQVYDDVTPEVQHLAKRSLQAGLLKLIAEGKCRETQRGYHL
jgi:glyoxylase-like metal-dependent hydrolase (beta-lactamase superfamily II)/8-oxo-dGTP pyrophosphatase MutT (NUDIX family)